MINYERLLRKYMRLVFMTEGTALVSYASDPAFDEEEIAELRRIDRLLDLPAKERD